MKKIMITLTFALATLTVASALVSKTPSSVVDHSVLLSDDNPPPVCPPICADSMPLVIVAQP